jgi:putative membrane protein
MYLLKKSLHNRTTWEHNDMASIRQRRALKIDDEEHYEEMMQKYLSVQDQQLIKGKSNPAAQILDKQSQHLAYMKSLGLTDDFRHVELQKLVTELYNEQGKCERIKNKPFPRQYATTGTIFIMIFMILLPFGMITEFLKLGDGMLWLLIPFNIVVNWVFLLMEYTGDVSENPFEGLINDVPVFTIVRNIEIDLREMIGDTNNLPEKIKLARLNVQH